MSEAAPPIDSRTAAEIERQLTTLLKTYAPNWNERDPATGAATGLSAALTGVFSRFAEITLRRLNQAPEKNRLAFLDMLGASPLSPQPARAPLTFTLAARAQGATVPAQTQVAAPPNADQPKGVIFETERDLSVTAATLARIVSWDAPFDTLTDHSAAAETGNAVPKTLFVGATPAEHVFYVDQDELFGFHDVTDFQIDVYLQADIPAPFDPREVRWEIWDGEVATPITPASPSGIADTTYNLTTSGRVSFLTLPRIPRATVAGRTSRWLRCRLLTPITRSATPVAGFVRDTQLPVVANVLLGGLGRGGDPVLPDAAFVGGAPADVSKDFYPFGPDAKFGTTWYLASRQVLSVAGRRIRLALTLTDAAAGVPAARATDNLVLKWEYWTGDGWTLIGASNKTGGGLGIGLDAFSDTTNALTQSGVVAFVLQKEPSPTLVNGVENYWLRVRLASGGYVPTDGATKPPVAPSLTEARLSYDTSNNPLSVVVEDGLARGDGAETVVVPTLSAPFIAWGDAGRSVYWGFALPPGSNTLPQSPVSLFADLANIPFGTPPDNAEANAGPHLTWTYWDGAGWSGLTVADDSAALTRSETLRFLPPADWTTRSLFGDGDLLWLRATWTGGDYKFLPRLRRALLNTVMAEQAAQVRGETLGSSTATANQTFTAAQTPILDGVTLDVIEPEWPAASENATAIGAEPGGGVRVRWREVVDFYASGPRDRHFMLDHQTGKVSFGDGVSGLIPPRGSGNLQLTAYRTGVGAGGDAPVGSITQLKTTVPYVDRVTNWLEAAGGVAGEGLDLLRERAPRMVRHGGRAVTIDDFQDLAALASPEVARALCVPLRDLTVDPDGAMEKPGWVSVIIVPRSASPRPAPSVELAERAQSFLRAAALPSASVVVVAPEYVTVSVVVQVVITELEAAAGVQSGIQAALAAFLHPLTGGLTGAGWDFGRRPHRSDLFGLLQAIDGVDHIRGLTVVETPDRVGAIETGRFLVCSGAHRIDLSFGTL